MELLKTAEPQRTQRIFAGDDFLLAVKNINKQRNERTAFGKAPVQLDQLIEFTGITSAALRLRVKILRNLYV